MTPPPTADLNCPLARTQTPRAVHSKPVVCACHSKWQLLYPFTLPVSTGNSLVLCPCISTVPQPLPHSLPTRPSSAPGWLPQPHLPSLSPSQQVQPSALHCLAAALLFFLSFLSHPRHTEPQPCSSSTVPSVFMCACLHRPCFLPRIHTTASTSSPSQYSGFLWPVT